MHITRVADIHSQQTVQSICVIFWMKFVWAWKMCLYYNEMIFDEDAKRIAVIVTRHDRVGFSILTREVTQKKRGN